MKERHSAGFWIAATLVFVGLPLLLWATGDFPRRTTLKESISLVTLLAYSLMLGQFFLSGVNPAAKRALAASRLVGVHKFIGYAFVVVLMVHPVMIVVPRSLEAGITPVEAFTTLITTWDSVGVLLGIGAWIMMLVLGVTSLVRGRLPMKFKSWKILHGILSIVFIVLATWHAVDLGRHADTFFSTYLILTAVGGAALLAWSYAAKPHNGERTHA